MLLLNELLILIETGNKLKYDKTTHFPSVAKVNGCIFRRVPQS